MTQTLLVCFTLVLILTIVTTEATDSNSQMFYPNGRYGRRSDPDVKLLPENETGKQDGDNSPRRHAARLSCTYLGFGDLYQCSMK
ncbi:hypothetical protein HDE_04288 [Halotydeus destructor]|nr:hypothetical protein HDE_04288 [Halotydeus destructor]